MTTMECNDHLALIPGYLDGELSEAQAAPLRRHLLDCRGCRTAAQGQRALSRWFEAELPVAVPPGFAAHVARRAFAGDTGDGRSPGASAQPAAARGEILQFVLHATAAAAVILIVVAGWLRGVDLPAGSDLRADDAPPASLEQVLGELDRLDGLDRAERVPAVPAPVAPVAPVAPAREVRER